MCMGARYGSRPCRVVKQGANFDNESYTVWILNHTADVDTFIESPTNIYILSINSEIVVYMIFFANKFLKSLY